MGFRQRAVEGLGIGVRERAVKNPKKIAITGAGGFLGKHLARALAERNDEPLLLVRSQSEDGLPYGLRQLELDFTDRQAIDAVLDHEGPDIIFHLAGTRGVGAGEHTWSTCVDLNVTSTVHLLESAQRNNVSRVVIIGSADEYGNQPGPLSEDLPLAPVSPYAVSKALATQIAQHIHSREACPVIILRPFTIFGPEQPSKMFVRDAIDCAVNGLPFRMTGGTQRRDLLYVDDAISAMLAAATAPGIEGKLINIGSGKSYALRDVASRVWELVCPDSPLMIGALEGTAGQLHDTWADISLAERLLGWSPRIELDEGLKRMIAWAQNQKTLNSRADEDEVLTSHMQ